MDAERLSAGPIRTRYFRHPAPPDGGGKARSGLGRDRGVDLLRRGHRRRLAQGGRVLETGRRNTHHADHHLPSPPPPSDRRQISVRSPERPAALPRRSRGRVVKKRGIRAGTSVPARMQARGTASDDHALREYLTQAVNGAEYLVLLQAGPLAAHDEVVNAEDLAIARDFLRHRDLVADDEPVAHEILER